MLHNKIYTLDDLVIIIKSEIIMVILMLKLKFNPLTTHFKMTKSLQKKPNSVFSLLLKEDTVVADLSSCAR